MASSIIFDSIHLATLQPLTLKEQAKEYLSHLFVGRLGSELRDRNRVGDFDQLVYFVVIRKLKSYFHSMHRHSPVTPRTPQPILHQPRIHGLNVVVCGGLTKSLIRKVCGAFKQRICNVFVHGGMVQRAGAFFYSHFFSLILLSMAALYAGLFQGETLKFNHSKGEA